MFGGPYKFLAKSNSTTMPYVLVFLISAHHFD